jgi:sialic acid synthase SpsE
VAAARGAGCREIALLHCTSGYPTPPEDSNLAALGELSRYDVVTGLSDHTLGIAVPIGAVARGAAIIEKHVTLRRADGGLDSAFSLEPAELAEMVTACQTVWQAIGRPHSGRAPSEAGNVVLRRSLYVVADIKAGEVLTIKNIRSIRPGHGLSPKHYPALLGRHALRDLPRGTPLDWSDFSE